MRTYLALKASLPRRKFAIGGRRCPAYCMKEVIEPLITLRKHTPVQAPVHLLHFLDTALSSSVAPPTRLSQSRLDSQNSLANLTLYHNDLDLLLANPSNLSQPQAWEHPVSLFNGGMANGTLITIKNHGLEMDPTQPQLARSHLHLPQLLGL